MYFGNIEKIEVTADKNLVNDLLADGWYVVEIITTYRKEKEFLFLLGFCNDFRAKLHGLVKKNSSGTGEAV